LSELGGNGCWLVSNKVLESSSGDVGIEEGTEVIGITLLSKFDSDWSWLVSDKVL